MRQGSGVGTRVRGVEDGDVRTKMADESYDGYKKCVSRDKNRGDLNVGFAT